MIGIYAIYRKSDDKCMYIGESKRIEGRIHDHLRGNATNTNFNYEDYYGKILQIFEYDDKEERLNIEADWINKLNPELNISRDRKTWNSGLTKDDNSSILKISKSQKLNYEKNPCCWVNNGKEEKWIHKNEKQNYLSNGYTSGRVGKRIWVNNGINEYLISENTLYQYSNEYKIGRLPRKKGVIKIKYPHCWINNGIEEKFIQKEYIQQYTDKGWVKGRLK